MGGKAHGGRRVARQEVSDLVDAILLSWAMKADGFQPAPITFEICGSYRRGKSDCGDIDIVVCFDEESLPEFDKWCEAVFGKLKNGKPARTGLVDGVQVEFYVATPENLGTFLQMWTGSMRHNIRLRGRAKKMGYSMSQYGFKNKDTDELTRCATEEEVYAFLNMDFVQPEDR